MTARSIRCRVCVAVLIFAGVARAESHKVRVGNRALAESLLAHGGKMVADYGGFQIIEMAGASSSAANPAQMQPVDNLNFIELNAGWLDTRTAGIQALRKSVGVFGGKRLHLVQFAGPVKPEWRAALEQSGAQVVCYVPEDAYLIYGDASSLGRVHSWAQASSYVQWEGAYANGYKINPRARRVDEKGSPQNPGPDGFAIQLVEDTNANPATLALIDRLKLGPVQNEFRTLHYLNVIVRLPPDQLPAIAAQPEVISIQPYYAHHKLDERQDQILAGNLAASSPTGPGYLDWLASKGFTQAAFDASGFVVDVSDSGIDNGTTSPGHFALYEGGNPGQPSRVVYSRLEGAPNRASTLQGCDGHGTLNAHIIAGYSALPDGFPHTDAGGFQYDLGVCPFVKLGASVIFDPDAFTNPKYPNLQSDAYHSGARISANSWGSDVSGDYDVDAQAFDALVRDAQPNGSTYAAAGNQEMVIVFAAGNAGPGSQTMDSPGTAKNVITVGAAENVRSLTPDNGGSDASGNDGCSTPDSAAASADDMSDFSGRGPCADGRMKPDLVAPGTHITGGVPQSGAPTTSGTGSAISCYNASGICALVGSGFFPLSQQFYTVSSGTSHATPAVAGACALLRQHFINIGLNPPSPAMTKAFLINSARYLTGAYANDTLWSASQGMGELDLGMAFDGVPRILQDEVPAEKFTASGQTRLFTGTVADPSKPFRVTLAWTDAPGNTTGNAFNNDLDLTVTVSGNTYKGNVFSGAYSVPGGSADYRNNVESVFLPAGVSGNFVVTATAANINSDGVPNEPPSLDQDFALVAYNAVERPVPVIALDSYAVTAENCSPTNDAIDPGESVTVQFALKNTGTADATNLLVALLATNGVVSPSGSEVYGAVPAGGGAVTQAFSFTAVGPCGGFIHPLLQLSDGSSNLGTLTFALPLGEQIRTTTIETNASVIAIPASGTVGPASPYPSPIVISGVTGTVSKVTVTLYGLSHTYPDDIDALLVGPTGHNVMFMSDAGGGNAITNVTLTFDDVAPNPIPDSSQISSGSYRPANYDPNSDNLPAPAPAAPFGQKLSLFNGLNPNGTWQLYIQDDSSGDAGSLAGGWSLTITTSNAVCCGVAPAAADLGVQQWTWPAAANLGDTVTFSILVTNGGPDTASSVVVTDALPPGLSFVSATASQGVCATNGAVVTCALEDLASGAVATVTLDTVAAVAGTWTNSAGVESATSDSITTNNAASAAVFINTPPTISAIPGITIDEDTPTGPIPFTIGDAETPASQLTLTAGSSDPNLVPPQNITFGGSDVNRTINILPGTNQNGACTITVWVNDGLASSSSSFLLTVNPVNDPPVLAPIPDQTVSLGSTLVITNSATDPDLPGDSLTFSLGTNAPPSATIDPVTGLFNWTPDNSYLYTTNPITVIVTDSGTPPLSDEQSFTVTVVPPPLVESISLSNNVATITWQAVSGWTYRVQYNDDLTGTNWIDLPPAVTATGPTASTVVAIGPGPCRFYRIFLP